MKLLVNGAKLPGLQARNCATVQQVLILKFSLGAEKMLGLSRNRPAAVVPGLNNNFLLIFSFQGTCASVDQHMERIST